MRLLQIQDEKLRILQMGIALLRKDEKILWGGFCGKPHAETFFRREHLILHRLEQPALLPVVQHPGKGSLHGLGRRQGGL